MKIEIGLANERSQVRDPFEWAGRVLSHFASAEQAIGRLSLALDLPIEKGALSNLADLRNRLVAAEDRHCSALNNRIARWMSHRPVRHLLAHATIHQLTDQAGRDVVITRHLPRDRVDVTPDRMWTSEEREELLRQATSDSRSISDQVSNLLSDKALVAKLKRHQPR